MSDRKLSLDKAEQLAPGSEHYRSYVGPPSRFDFMSLSQLGILFAFGLRETDTVLDFGCGSLRAGRMLIPFLREKKYFGIEPNKWLIEDGIDRELGRDATTLKKPVFSYDDNFDCTVFNKKFDFILAQSIVTHAGPNMARKLFESASMSLKDDGVLLLSYKPGIEQTPLPSDGWSYPQNILYSPSTMLNMLKDYGLSAIEIPWFHPGAQWLAASLNSQRLPTKDEFKLLAGQPTHRE